MCGRSARCELGPLQNDLAPGTEIHVPGAVHLTLVGHQQQAAHSVDRAERHHAVRLELPDLVHERRLEQVERAVLLRPEQPLAGVRLEHRRPAAHLVLLQAHRTDRRLDPGAQLCLELRAGPAIRGGRLVGRKWETHAQMVVPGGVHGQQVSGGMATTTDILQTIRNNVW